MIKSTFGENLDATIQRLFPFLFRWNIHPNAWSVAGLVVSCAAAACWYEGAFRIGAGLVLFGGFFDLTDGVVARHQGRSSEFGAFLDSTLDRVVDIALLLALALHWARADMFALAWLAASALLFTVLVSYTKARAESVVPGFKGGILERAERIVILVAGALFGVLPWAVGLVAIGSAVTAGQRIALAYQRMAELDAGGVSEGPEPVTAPSELSGGVQ